MIKLCGNKYLHPLTISIAYRKGNHPSTKGIAADFHDRQLAPLKKKRERNWSAVTWYLAEMPVIPPIWYADVFRFFVQFRLTK